MITYKTKNNPNVLETYENETLISTSQTLDFDDWTGFVFWVEHFTTTAVWDADFLFQCYLQSKQS
jgi:hypothetical protein